MIAAHWHVETQHIIPIHFYVPLIGSIAAAVIVCFSLGLVISLSSSEDGLKYISNGMDVHCGWAELVLGTAATVVGACYLIPAVHVGGSLTIGSVLVQLITWNTVLGVQDTGWSIHYAALGGFCVANIYFNLVMSRSWYGCLLYRRINALSILVALVFMGSFMAQHLSKSEVMSSAARDASVCIELMLTACFSAQTFCLMWGMNKDASMHIVIDRYPM